MLIPASQTEFDHKVANIQTYISSLVSQMATDYCDVRWEEIAYTRFSLNNLQVESLEESEVSGGCVRILVNGAWGIATFVDINRLEGSLKSAWRLAELAARSSPSPLKLADVTIHQTTNRFPIKEDPRKITLSEKLQMFRDYSDDALTLPVVQYCKARYYDEMKSSMLVTSDGISLVQEQRDLYGSLTLETQFDGRIRSTSVYQGSSTDYGMLRTLKSQIQSAGQQLEERLVAPSLQAGTYTVVLGPEIAGLFIHEAFGHLCEADSMVKDNRIREFMKLGRRLAVEQLNVYDTGVEVGTRGYVPFDDEGVVGQRVDLLYAGRLVGRLHSRETAAQYSERPTGNARAFSYRFPPICRMRATCIEPGNMPFDSMLRDIPLGIYVDGPGGGKVDGDKFNFVALDVYMIRNGRLAERISEVSLGGTIFKAFDSLDGVGSKAVCHDTAGGCGKGGQGPLRVSTITPHLRLREIFVKPR